MLKLTISFLLALTIVPVAFSQADTTTPTTATTTQTTTTQAKTAFRMIHAAQLAHMMESRWGKTHLYVFDANTAKVRGQYGVIPGAKMLASSSKYDLSVLPTNKTEALVFYCANTMCTASHSAAERAMSAGYHHVFVMMDGIMGWKQSGHPTTPTATTPATTPNT